MSGAKVANVPCNSPQWRVPITHQAGAVIGLVTPEVSEDDRHPHIYFSSIIILLSSGFTYSNYCTA